MRSLGAWKIFAIAAVACLAVACATEEDLNDDLDLGGAADCVNEWECDEEEQGEEEVSEAQELVLRDETYLQRACQGLLDQVPDTTTENYWGNIEESVEVDTELDAAIRDYTLYQSCVDAGYIVGRSFPPNCSGVNPPDSRGFDMRIALTFDDGPASYTPGILDTLQAHNAPAVFFVNGRNINSSNRSVLIRAIEEDHLVGHHTHSHVNSSKQNVDTYYSNQIAPTNAILSDLYSDAGEDFPKIPFFRFPYGATTCQINEEVMNTAGHEDRVGYQIVGWHIDTADWCFNAGNGTCPRRTFRWVPDQYRDDFIGYTLSQAHNRQGGILLLHDVKAYTGRVLDELLTALEADGFSFVRLDDEDMLPKLNDGIGLGDGTIPTGNPESIPFNGASCSGENSQYNCVDVADINFRNGLCDGEGNTVGGFCPGPWNIKCCVNDEAY